MGRNDSLLNELDRKFANKNNYGHEIAIKRVELFQRENDENIGGGSAGFISKPTEMKVIKEMSDPFIQNRLLWLKAIDETLQEQSGDIQVLLEKKYWGEDQWMDWRSFGVKYGYSKTAIYRIRQQVLMNFGRKIGELS